jgi:predicted transcriptional regulator
MTATTPKQRALDALKNLPQDATMEDAIERLLFIAKVEKGIADADADKTIPHEEIVKRMKR